MLSDKEKKAIEKFKNIIYTYQDVIEDEYSDYEEKESAKEYQEVSETILNLIEKQFKEIEILSKNINLLREQNISYKQSIHTLKEIEQQHKTDNGLLNQELDMQIEHNKELDMQIEHNKELEDAKIVDKIKAKIEPKLKELDEQINEEWKKYGNSKELQDMEDMYNFLQSLLEEE